MPTFGGDMSQFLKVGDRGEWVRYLQNLPNRRLQAYPSLWVDGQFGTATEAAVRYFQSTRPPLKVDGKVGEKTWTVLEAGPPLIRKRPPMQTVIETHGGGV